MQAFLSLLTALWRLRHDNNDDKNKNNEAEPFPLLKQWEDYPKPTAQTPPAYRFLTSLPALSPANPGAAGLTCNQCHLPFEALPADPAAAVVLPPQTVPRRSAHLLPCSCGHLICFGCLWDRLRPTDPANRNDCPGCGTILFDKYPPPDTIEGLQSRIDLAEWVPTPRGQSWPPPPPVHDPGYRRGIRGLKVAVAWHWYALATEEAGMEEGSSLLAAAAALGPRDYDTKPVVEREMAVRELRFRRRMLGYVRALLVQGEGEVGGGLKRMEEDLGRVLGTVREMQG